MTDNSFFQNGNISVTTTLVKIGNASYSLANIGSVYIAKQKTMLFWVLGIFCILLTLLMFGATQDTLKSDQSVSVWAYFPALFFAAIAASFLYRAIKPKYFLVFKTSSADQRVLESREYATLGPIKFAIERAITARG